MARVNKTENNLQKVWDNLDKAYQYMNWALEDLSSMTDLSKELLKDLDNFDISAIGCMKSDVEDLLEQLKE